MHLMRLVVAVILLPLFYLYIMKLPAEYFLLLLMIVSIIAQAEFYSMYNVRGLLKYSGIVLGIAIISITYISRNLFADFFVFSFLLIASMRLLLKRDPSSSLHDIAPVAVALIYIPGMLGYQMHLREQGSEWIIFLYGCVWTSDSFAYYIGKGIGKRKLYKEVSPNKTVAGGVGSIVGGAVAAVVLNAAFIHSMPLAKAAIIGIIIGIVAVIGDLVESMFKRDTKVKDSGHIIPGHGGMLDKLDGVLFAGPMLYWVSIAFGIIQ